MTVRQQELHARLPTGRDGAMSWRPIVAFGLISLVLHWSWETAHGIAYVETNVPFAQRFWHCLPMAVVDTAWSGAIVVLAIAAARGLRRPSAVWSVAAAAGAATAVAVERYAVEAGRWRYNDLMPMVPVVDVGLWPVAQMSVVPLLTLYLTYLAGGLVRRR